jgi:hypothetical protein
VNVIVIFVEVEGSREELGFGEMDCGTAGRFKGIPPAK